MLPFVNAVNQVSINAINERNENNLPKEINNFADFIG